MLTSHAETGMFDAVCVTGVCVCVLQSTEHAEAGMFDAECVLHQIRSLQVTPTVQLMAAGKECIRAGKSEKLTTQPTHLYIQTDRHAHIYI